MDDLKIFHTLFYQKFLVRIVLSLTTENAPFPPLMKRIHFNPTYGYRLMKQLADNDIIVFEKIGKINHARLTPTGKGVAENLADIVFAIQKIEEGEKNGS